jgi:hypothetical protein
VFVDNTKKIVSVHAIEAGGVTITVAGKRIPIRIKSVEEVAAEEQKAISEITGTVVSTETQTDPETGEEKEVIVVNSKLNITPGHHPWSMYVGETYNIPINFENNTANVTLSDCNIESHFEDGGSIKSVVSGNILQVTPQSTGKWCFGVHYPGANGFDTG